MAATATATATARQARGLAAHRAGCAAEEATARLYAARGSTVVARRWRRREGEIDLIVRDGDALAFVEVKSGRFAAEAIGGRQWARLEAAALRYMLENETGETPARFDAALVGPDGAVSVIENARGFEAW
jgi:putative endonuclease